MAYVITDTCTKDGACLDECPNGSIVPAKDDPQFETVPQLYINPDECIDCGACVPVCPSNSIFVLEELPEDQKKFIEVNANYFK